MPPIPPGLATPDLLGRAHEALLAPQGRRRSGAFYTPAAVASSVVGWALEALTAGGTGPVRVCDPAVGGGVFLLAAAEHLAGTGRSRAAIVGSQLFGSDVDPLAVAVTEAALALWAWDDGPVVAPADALRVGDALSTPVTRWPGAGPEGFDVVAGNPPFLGQLHRDTARDREEAVALGRRLGAAAGGYADTAALFLVHALDLVRPGGVVALLQPESFLAARDTGPARRALLEDAELAALWVAGEPVFEAGVRVCAPVLRRGRGPAAQPVALHAGATPRRAGTAPGPRRGEAPWSPLVAAVRGVPGLDGLRAEGVLGDWCAATADFRDQYYGLVPHVREAAELPEGTPLVTTGLIDPASCRWGRAPARFAKRRWDAPVVDLGGLGVDPALDAWASRRLVPKVLVATQTKVLEAVVDDEGRWLPSTPVLTVTADPARLWHLAAVLCSPVASAWALANYGGTALASGAVKLSAGQLLTVPSPPGGPDWDAAADAIRRAHAEEGEQREALIASGRLVCAAYGVPAEPLVGWWAGRLPDPDR